MKIKSFLAFIIWLLVFLIGYAAGGLYYKKQLAKLRTDNFGSLDMSDLHHVLTLKRLYPFIFTDNVELVAECYLVYSRKDNADQLDALNSKIVSSVNDISVEKFRDMMKLLTNGDWRRRLPYKVSAVSAYLEAHQDEIYSPDQVQLIRELIAIATENVYPLSPGVELSTESVDRLLVSVIICARKFIPELVTKYTAMYAHVVTNNGRVVNEAAIQLMNESMGYVGSNKGSDTDFLTIFGYVLVRKAKRDRSVKIFDLASEKMILALKLQDDIAGRLCVKNGLLRTRFEKLVLLDDNESINHLLKEAQDLIKEYSDNKQALGFNRYMVHDNYVVEGEIYMYLGNHSLAIASYQNAISAIAEYLGKNSQLERDYQSIIDKIKSGALTEDNDAQVL